jgi:hypothetical protein
MTNSKAMILAGAIVVGAAVSLFIQQASRARFQEREAMLRRQEVQLATLTAEHERLSNLIANVANNAAFDDRTAELAKLRVEAETLKKQTNDLGRQLEQNRAAQPVLSVRPMPVPESHPPEYWQQLQQLAGSKPWEARDLASAIVSYASDHQNQCPSNLDQVASYLAKSKQTLSGTNEFEIIYQGSFDRLEGIPRGNVAVLRDQQIWAAPDGKLMRVYGMGNGSGQTVGSDDNFQSWEAEHVIAPAKAGR